MVDVSRLELEDLYIIEEKPLKVKIGRRFLLISSLPLRRVDRFERMFASLLIRWSAYIGNIDMLNYAAFQDEEKKELFVSAWKRLLKKEKRFLVDVCKLICEPYRFSVRYFMRHSSYDTVTQCFLASQLINYDAVKKNIQFLLTQAGIKQQQRPSLVTLRENMDGAKTRRLVPRY